MESIKRPIKIYDSLIKQIQWIEEYIKANQIESYEQIIESEIHKSILIFKFIILQKSINRESKSVLKRYYNIKLDKFSWIDADYLDSNNNLHYDCLWDLIRSIDDLKNELIKLKGSPKYKDKDSNVICSFCGKDSKNVFKIVAGTNAYICNECIELCNDILNEFKKENTSKDIYEDISQEETQTASDEKEC